MKAKTAINRRLVSVYVNRMADIRGLAAWQWLLLFVTLSAVWVIGTTTPLPFIVKAFLMWIIGCTGIAFVGFPTSDRPLKYFGYLRKLPPLKPEARLISLLPDGSAHCELFGEGRILLSCKQLPARPTIDDESVRLVSRFLAIYGAPLEMITTTGRPSCNPHMHQFDEPLCLLTAKLSEDEIPQQAAEKLRTAAQSAGLQLLPIDESLFDVVAGHGVVAAHYMVDKMPYVLAIGWLDEIRNAPCHFNISVNVCPSDMEAVRKGAGKVLADSFVSYHALAQPTVGDAGLAVRRAAREVLDGKTTAFDISIDITVLAQSSWELFLSDMFLKIRGAYLGIKLKHVRSRVLPFAGAFCEPAVPYSMTVAEAAAVACCPFFVEQPPPPPKIRYGPYQFRR